MKPITRKELYLNKIVGNNDYETPEKPISEEEFFFAEILGEAVQAPEPLTRYQIYLAKIAGRNIEIPYPKTRLEYFLAKAAGMDISTPVPITKEEIYWSNYTAIVEFELDGVPPLTYKAIEGTLKNYRIYGQTVDGESVGDRTGNLFDGEFLQGYWAYANGTFSPDTAIMFRWVCTPKIPCIGNMTYTFSFDNPSRWAGFVWFDINGDYISTNNRNSGFDNGGNFTATSPANAAFMGINIAGRDSTGQVYYDIYPSDVTDFMLVEGSTPLPYEPYGYRVPVTINDITTNLYLPEQIKMVGDEAEYIDYGEQKQHFADGTFVDVTLPALPTITGTNTLSIGTTVQPSKVYIKGEKGRE